MKDNDFINDLVDDHKEVQKTPSLLKRFLSWFVICLLCLGAGISFLGLREDWMILIKTPSLLLQNIFILVGVMISGMFAIKLSTPGAIKKKKNENLLYGLAIVWSVILLIMGLWDGVSLHNFSKIGIGCVVDIIVIGIIPGIALFFFMAQGVVLERRLAAITGMIAAFGIGAFGVQYTCHNDDPIHVLLWHFLPLIGLAFIGGLLSKKIFKKL